MWKVKWGPNNLSPPSPPTATPVLGAAGGGHPGPHAPPPPGPPSRQDPRRPHAACPAVRRVVLHQPLHQARPLRQAPRRPHPRLPRPPAPRQPPRQCLRPPAGWVTPGLPGGGATSEGWLRRAGFAFRLACLLVLLLFYLCRGFLVLSSFFIYLSCILFKVLICCTGSIVVHLLI